MNQPDVLNNEKHLAKYLQTVWANAKIVDWLRLGSLNAEIKKMTSQKTPPKRDIVGTGLVD